MFEITANYDQSSFSGVSWLISESNSGLSHSLLEVVPLWPTSADNRRKNTDSPKVPTKIHYNER